MEVESNFKNKNIPEHKQEKQISWSRGNQRPGGAMHLNHLIKK